MLGRARLEGDAGDVFAAGPSIRIHSKPRLG